MATKYSDEMLVEAVADAKSVREVLRAIGAPLDGGTHAHITKRIRGLGLDTSHFTGQGWSRGVPSPRRKPPEEVLVKLPDGSARASAQQLRRVLLEVGLPYKCAICGNLGQHNGQALRLEIDHINGDCVDNRRENLRFLCPNCHAQVETTLQGSRKSRSRGTVSQCCDCESPISPSASRCRPCAGKARDQDRIEWPSLSELTHLAALHGYEGTARILKVSGTSVRKRINRLENNSDK